MSSPHGARPGSRSERLGVPSGHGNLAALTRCVLDALPRGHAIQVFEILCGGTHHLELRRHIRAEVARDGGEFAEKGRRELGMCLLNRTDDLAEGLREYSGKRWSNARRSRAKCATVGSWTIRDAS